jgi:hypothetical protein
MNAGRRPAALLRALAGCATAPEGKATPGGFGVRVEEVRFAGGGLTLAGALSLPDAGGRRPAVVIVPGSGPATRDFALYARVAEHLARRGFVMLRYDKPGAGASQGDWSAEDFSDRARHALDAAEYLRGRPEVDPERVGLVGHSQGGWIAPLAASLSDRIAFVVMLAGAAATPAEQDLLSQRHRLEALGAPPADVEDAVVFTRKCHEYARGLLPDAEFEELLRETPTKGWWKSIAPAGVAIEDIRKAVRHLAKILDRDPIPPLKRLRCPLLALFGERDTCVVPAENVPPLRESLEAAKHTDFRIEIVPDATHTFTTAGSGGKELSAAMLARLSDWIVERASGD